MSLTFTTAPPLMTAVASARETLAGVADAQPIYLSVAEKEQLLVDLAGLQAQVDELRLRALAASEEVAEEHGARDVAAWLAHATRVEAAKVRADACLADALAGSFTRTARALAAGAVNVEQARVIVDCVTDLPDRVGIEVKAQAELDLIGFAADFAPSDLRRLGGAILHVSCPEIADDEDARRLQDQEQAAQEKASLRFRPTGEGTTRVSILLPDADAARLAAYLDAYTNPRRDHASEVEEVAQQPSRDQPTGSRDGRGRPPRPPGDDGPSRPADRVPRHRRLAHAFARLLEHLDPHALPTHGGDATTVVVTIGLDQLTTGLGTATLTNPLAADGTTKISVTQARRLACTAGILPAVLGGDGEVLDLGRRQRLFTPAIRRALGIRHHTCRAEGCTIPARWCEAHHRSPWSEGGATSLVNADLYCSHHHHLVHDPGYSHDVLPDGSVRFHRRP